MVARVGAEVTIGGQVEVHVRMKTKAVLESKIHEVANSCAKKYHLLDKYQEDQKRFHAGGGFNFLFGLFGLFGGAGYES